MDATREPEFLAVAKIGAPRGVQGSLKLHSYSGETRHILSLSEALVAPEGQPAAGKRLRVKSVEAGPWGISMAFGGFGSPEEARALTGMEIFVPRSQASPLGENEWYIHDLIGLKLVLDGAAVAQVRAVLDGGADPLLEVVPSAGGHSLLVPFRKEFVGDIDLDHGTIELLAGWLLE